MKKSNAESPRQELSSTTPDRSVRQSSGSFAEPTLPPETGPHTDTTNRSVGTDGGLISHLLGIPRDDGLADSRVASWNGNRGMLQDGRTACLGASCLLRPEAGDRVLTWSGDQNCWVLAVLERSSHESPAVIGTDAPSLAIQASRISLAGQAVHIASKDFLTSTQNRHAVESIRTENCKVRVSQIGTDIRRVVTADEEVSGTLLQKAGTWLSSTVRDARLRARTFLFD